MCICCTSTTHDQNHTFTHCPVQFDAAHRDTGSSSLVVYSFCTEWFHFKQWVRQDNKLHIDTHAHTNTHMHTHTCTRTDTHSHTWGHTYTQIHRHTHVHTHGHMRTHIHTHTHTHTLTPLTKTHSHIYKYALTDKHRHTLTNNNNTHTHTHTHIHQGEEWRQIIVLLAIKRVMYCVPSECLTMICRPKCQSTWQIIRKSIRLVTGVTDHIRVTNRVATGTLI